jgi:hypothetical protein
MENDIPSQWNPKHSRSIYTRIRQSRLQTKIRRDIESPYTLINEIIHQEDMIINMLVPKVDVPIFIK